MPKKKRTLKEKRAQKRTITIGVAITLFVLLIVSVALVSRLPEVTIAEVRVDGAHSISEADVRTAVEQKLAGSYFWLVPKKNTLLYPEHAIEDVLRESFPPIHLVDVTRDGFTKLVVAIEERQPVAVWCERSASSSGCYFMDDTGLLFESGDVNPAFVTYQGGVEGEPLGAHFIDGEFETLRQVVSDLHTATTRSPERVVVDEYDDIYVYFKEGGEVRFVRRYEPRALLDNIASVFSSNRFETEDYFEYADFRFGNKVYVKFSE